jgi:hypothetical protein
MPQVTAALTCPSWCGEHERDLSTPDLVMVHRRRVGQVEVSLVSTLTQDGWTWADGGRPTLRVPDLHSLDPVQHADISDDLRHLALVLDGVVTILG